jgi:hypothetical protein
VNEGHFKKHSATSSIEEDLPPIVSWTYTLAENPSSKRLEREIIAHRGSSHDASEALEPFTFRELLSLVRTGCTEAKPVMPFHLSSETARRAAILERGSEAIRAEFEAFKQSFHTYEQKAHHEKTALDRIKTLSPDGEMTPTVYRAYLSRFKADLPFLFGVRHFPLSESYREAHTYVSAGSGMGKSTVLRDMAYHYARDPESPSLIVIDPHGGLAESIARFDIPNFDDRLIYFKPYLGRGVYPVLNPFDTKNKERNAIDTATDEFVGQFRTLLSGMDAETSQQMDEVLRVTVKALMQRKDLSTLDDLVRFLDPVGVKQDKTASESYPYWQEAQAVLSNPADRHFLAKDFYSATYVATKQAIRTRLRALMGSDALYHSLNGESTFDLRKAMNTKGRVIVFNLSGLGQNVTDTLGRFFTGMIQSIAMERENIPEAFRPKTHFFIDECQRFINGSIEKILNESRKFKLFLTLSQQVVGYDMSSDLERAIMANTGIKVAGLNDHKSLSTLSKNMGVVESELKHLAPYYFYASGTRFPPLKFKTANIESDILRTDFFGSSDTTRWDERKRAQIARYYRRPIQPFATPQTPANGDLTNPTGHSHERAASSLDPSEFIQNLD